MENIVIDNSNVILTKFNAELNTDRSLFLDVNDDGYLILAVCYHLNKETQNIFGGLTV